MNETGLVRESEFVLRRLGEAYFLNFGPGATVARVLLGVAVALVGLGLTAWLYRADLRSAHAWAGPLAVLRLLGLGGVLLGGGTPGMRFGAFEAFPLGYRVQFGGCDHGEWLPGVLGVLLFGLSVVAGAYARDKRAAGWWAVPLAGAKFAAWVLIACAFLLPANQIWEKAEKRSRVVVVLDVSGSMTQVSDEPASPGGPKPATRMGKVLDFLTDEKVAFLRRVLDKNPVAVYRFGTRLDDESLPLAGSQPAWAKADWDAWVRYDFKPWALRGLSPAGAEAVKRTAGWKGDEPGTADWAVAWAKLPDAEAVPGDLDPADAAALKDNRGKLEKRVDVARSIAGGTDVPDSLTAVVNRESANMVQGVIVFTDGRSNLGSESAYAELKERATRENIPLFTVAVGEARENVRIAVTDVQVPDRVPPDEPFKITVEADGVGLDGKEVEVKLGLYLPTRDPKKDAPDHELTGTLKFQPGDPPHGTAEFTVDPDKLPDALIEESKKGGKKLQMKQGAWAAVARIARDKREAFPDPDHVSPPRAIQVIDKPLRVLLFAGGPTREYQTLRTLFVRETKAHRAELSIYLQSEGGKAGTAVQDVPPDHLLTRFPTRLTLTGGAAEKPEEKIYDLNQYDLIVAFDPDWSELSDDQVRNLSTWVENVGGGLVYVAGPVNTYQLARADDTGRLQPLLRILPVDLDDIILLKTRAIPRTPRRLRLSPGQTGELLKLDEDKKDDPTAGWEEFFTGAEKYKPDADPRANLNPARGFYAYYPLKGTRPGAAVLAELLDQNDRGEAEPKPWLVTNEPGGGRTAFLASGELWRLRGYEPGQDFYTRFWVKLARYAAAKRDVKAARGRVLMGKEFVSGSPVRVQVRLLTPGGQPYKENEQNPKFKVVAYNAAGEKLNKEFGPYELKPRKGGGGFEGYYAGQVVADPRILPPGENRYRVVVEVPDSTGDTIDGEFAVKKSDPELDNPRPDFAALYAAASPVETVEKRVADPAVLDKLRGSAADAGKAKLAFRLAETDRLGLIPECLKPRVENSRSRGPVDDLWDKPLRFPAFGTEVRLLDFTLTPEVARWGCLAAAGFGGLLLAAVLYSLAVNRRAASAGRVLTLLAGVLFLAGGAVEYFQLDGAEFAHHVEVAALLLAVVGLLSFEWLVRKLLRLA